MWIYHFGTGGLNYPGKSGIKIILCRNNFITNWYYIVYYISIDNNNLIPSHISVYRFNSFAFKKLF